MRNALACVSKRNRPMVAAALQNAFYQPNGDDGKKATADPNNWAMQQGNYEGWRYD